MHLVVITSVIRPQNAASVFSSDERFQQLLESIRSARQNIPQCLITIIEGSSSSYTDDQIKALTNSGAHEIVHINVNRYDKQSGELFLLKSFFCSEMFANLKEKHDISSISKLSGRYAFTDDFVFHYDGKTCICKIGEPSTSYSGNGFLYTRYYSFPIIYLENFIDGLEKCCRNGIFINIEHSFYRYDVLPLDKINRDMQKINVCGRIAPTGEYVQD